MTRSPPVCCGDSVPIAFQISMILQKAMVLNRMSRTAQPSVRNRRTFPSNSTRLAVECGFGASIIAVVHL